MNPVTKPSDDSEMTHLQSQKHGAERAISSEAGHTVARMCSVVAEVTTSSRGVV